MKEKDPQHQKDYALEMRRLLDDPAQDRLLTIGEAAAHLQTSVDWLYRHHDELPFTVRLSERQLRFSLKGIEEFIKDARKSVQAG